MPKHTSKGRREQNQRAQHKATATAGGSSRDRNDPAAMMASARPESLRKVVTTTMHFRRRGKSQEPSPARARARGGQVSRNVLGGREAAFGEKLTLHFMAVASQTAQGSTSSASSTSSPASRARSRRGSRRRGSRGGRERGPSRSQRGSRGKSRGRSRARSRGESRGRRGRDKGEMETGDRSPHLGTAGAPAGEARWHGTWRMCSRMVLACPHGVRCPLVTE